MTALLPTIAMIGMLPANGPVAWSFTSQPASNGSITIDLTARIEKGWHIYATELPNNDGPIATSFRFMASEAFVVVGKPTEPTPEEHYDPNCGMTVRYHSGTPHFLLTVMPRTHEAFTFEGEVEFMVCNDKTCLPPTVVPITVRVEPLQKK